MPDRRFFFQFLKTRTESERERERGRERKRARERERKKLASRERETHFSPGTHYGKHTKPFLFQGQTRNNEL